MTVAAAMPATISVASAAEAASPSRLSALAEREMIRRQQAVTEADRLLAEGRTAYAKRDYQQAFDKCKEALSVLPDAPMLADRHAAITSHLADASVALAQQFRRQGGDAKKGDKGSYEDARALLETVLKEDPENVLAKREIGFLEDPIRTNPGLNYKHTQDVDKVRRGLYTAEGFYNLAKYDEAKREYENVLRVDQYNTAAPADPFAGGAGAEKAGIKVHKPIIELLKKIATFAEGSSASLSPSGLLVTNTSSELDKIESFVEANSITQPKQIKITTKFVEVTQENTDELSFDWLVTPFGLSSNTLFGSGGTTGDGLARTGADFVNPVNGVSIPGVPSNPALNADNVATNGLRSGTGAISGNSIDSLLNNPLRTASTAKVAPGIAAVTGLFSGGQVQLIMRGLAQKKGADLMTAPSVTAKPGQKATIQIIREFIYATEYEPPQLPQQGNQGGNILGGGGGGAGIATPATPSAWETRNTGVTLEIEPSIADNNYVIDLRFVPEIVEFEGFINYGSPIKAPSVDVFGNPTTVVITDNRIEMPVFSTRRVNTSLSIYDGYTVAVGGLIREDVQNVQDSVPIFGSIPIIGRLFQSKAENRIKSNLIIFVTAQIIDATGRPLRGSEPNTPPVGEAPPAAPGEVLPPLE